MIRALAIGAAAAGLIACTPWKEAGVPIGPVAQTQAAAAQHAVDQACGPFGSKQHGGTDGTTRADYDCEGPSK
jgi:hypothetical protein